MPVRLIITIDAAAGCRDEVGALLAERAAEVVDEPGCEQFEVFQSLAMPDRFTILELWQDPAALDAHAALNKTRKSFDPALFANVSRREDYVYNRTR